MSKNTIDSTILGVFLGVATFLLFLAAGPSKAAQLQYVDGKVVGITDVVVDHGPYSTTWDVAFISYATADETYPVGPYALSGYSQLANDTLFAELQGLTPEDFNCAPAGSYDSCQLRTAVEHMGTYVTSRYVAFEFRNGQDVVRSSGIYGPYGTSSTTAAPYTMWAVWTPTTVQPVPEPGAAVMAYCGITLMAYLRRSR